MWVGLTVASALPLHAILADRCMRLGGVGMVLGLGYMGCSRSKAVSRDGVVGGGGDSKLSVGNGAGNRRTGGGRG